MDTYLISERFQLRVSEVSLLVFQTGSSEECLLELPKARFIRAGINSWTNPLANHHYHHITQRRLSHFDTPHIENIVAIEDGVSISGTIAGKKGSVSFKLALVDHDGLVLSAAITGKGANRLYLGFTSLDNERFYGFGEQFTHFDLTGMKFPLITGEQGIGRGAQPLTAILESKSGSGGDAFTTYAPMPVTVTSRNRAFYVNNDCVMYADIKKSEKNLASFELWSDRAELRVWQGKSLLDAISLHTAVTGRFRPLPLWAHNVIAGLRGGKAQVERVLAQCAAHNVPVSAIWIEDWVGRRGKNYGPPLWWRWAPNEEVYPDFRNWVRSLNGKGIKVLAYFNSFIADDKDFYQCREALERDYFVKDKSGSPCLKKTGSGFGYYMVDLANAAAFSWLKSIIKRNVLDYGISGWMADYGEYLSFDTCISGGLSGEEYHQRYATEWLRLNREAADELGLGNDLLIFNRCGSSHGNRHALCFWEGDQNVTWDEHDGLASSIVGLLSGGMSGIALNHADIGGHTTLVNPAFSLVRSRELFWRWCEMAAFTPVYRTHDGTLTEPNHQFYSSPETMEFFGRMGRLHACFTDYFIHLEEEASAKGYPLIRHTLLHDAAAEALDLRYQFMLGPDIVIFPVRHAGAKEVKGYIPAGTWILPWSGQTFEGSRHATFDAPLGRPAFLVRQGGVWGDILLTTLRDFIRTEGRQ